MLESKIDQTIVEGFDEFLVKNNLRHTPERYNILQEIKKSSDHFEADELFFQLRQKKIAVSRATVYRTLSLLEESGIIRKLRFGENHYHYELITTKKPHAHLVCTNCGKIIEFDDKALEKIQNQICDKNRYQPVRRTVEIYGVCPACQLKKK